MRTLIDFEKLRTGAGIFEVLSKAEALEREGREILHFEIGQPDFTTPKHVKEAAMKAIDDDFTGYVAASGIRELKEAIQDEIEITRDFRPTLKQILVVAGGNSGIYYMMRAAIQDPGNEEIVYPDPGFPTYAAIVNYLNVGRVPITLKEKNEFRLNPTDIEAKINPKTKILVINSPSNPLGSVMTKQEIDRVSELAEEHGFYILSDEVYSKMTYDQKFHSATIRDEAKERSVLLESFSKSYSMCGWRLGYLIGPEWLIDRMGLLISATVSCVSSFTQKAGVAALRGPQDELVSNMKAFRERRNAIAKGLNEIPNFSCLTPEGAFYTFPNIKKTGMSSKELSDHLLYNAGVACLPGTIFGDAGEGYLRFSYATSVNTINKAIKRIRESFR